MHLRTWSAALAAAISFGTGTMAEAQTGRMHLGPRVTYNFDFEEVAIGGQLAVPLTGMVDFYPSFDVFFVDNGSLFGFNADLKFRPLPVATAPLYLGAGLNLTRGSSGGSSDTNAGVNLFGGLEARTGAVHPFGELRLVIGDGSSVQLSAGINFTIGAPSTRVR
jgi:hypothetical protein